MLELLEGINKRKYKPQNVLEGSQRKLLTCMSPLGKEHVSAEQACTTCLECRYAAISCVEVIKQFPVT